MAQLSENFIFIYLGLTIFTQQEGEFRWALILFTFLFIILGRAASVFPLAFAINFVSEARSIGWKRRIGMGWNSLGHPDAPLSQTIPQSHQIMLCWAGLRGAIAFALSMDIQTPSAHEVRTTTLVVVVLSILIFGGTSIMALQRLQIRTGVDEDAEDDDLGPFSQVLIHRCDSTDIEKGSQKFK